VIEHGGRRWIGLPARRFREADGAIHYQPLIEFATPKADRNFRAAALKVVEAYLKVMDEW
jgi:hypothetical protein